ncbi:MAG TPA: SMC-Scp complex subunit ScpB [Nitrososphaerales archaeon]|nr:SMC-Scp complex subunit ScpB [Nitrososphaerales archaeon]
MSEPQQEQEQAPLQEQVSRPKVSDGEIRARIEAALYSSGRALDAEQLARAAGISSKKRAMDEAKAIQSRMKSMLSAIEVVEYPGQRYAMQLKAEYTNVARKFATKPLLSKAALRTLSFIAYFQPISSADLALRRGSQAYDHLKDLEEVGFLAWERKGRSKLYRTTTEFSEYFGLSVDPQTLKHQLERRALILR